MLQVKLVPGLAAMDVYIQTMVDRKAVACSRNSEVEFPSPSSSRRATLHLHSVVEIPYGAAAAAAVAAAAET